MYKVGRFFRVKGWIALDASPGSVLAECLKVWDSFNKVARISIYVKQFKNPFPETAIRAQAVAFSG